MLTINTNVDQEYLLRQFRSGTKMEQLADGGRQQRPIPARWD
jgi:hypothetical protein